MHKRGGERARWMDRLRHICIIDHFPLEIVISGMSALETIQSAAAASDRVEEHCEIDFIGCISVDRSPGGR